MDARARRPRPLFCQDLPRRRGSPAPGPPLLRQGHQDLLNCATPPATSPSRAAGPAGSLPRTLFPFSWLSCSSDCLSLSAHEQACCYRLEPARPDEPRRDPVQFMSLAVSCSASVKVDDPSAKSPAPDRAAALALTVSPATILPSPPVP